MHGDDFPSVFWDCLPEATTSYSTKNMLRYDLPVRAKRRVAGWVAGGCSMDDPSDPSMDDPSDVPARSQLVTSTDVMTFKWVNISYPLVMTFTFCHGKIHHAFFMGKYPLFRLGHGFNSYVTNYQRVHQPTSIIWVNYNNSLTWIKAIWGWFPLLTMISSEVVVSSL